MVVQLVELELLYEDILLRNKNDSKGCLQLEVKRYIYKSIGLGWRLCFNWSVFGNYHAVVVG